MLMIDRLAEEQIAAAIRRGQLDKLPGRGKPLILDDDSGIPSELRVAYRILKNAGCLPPRLALNNEIQQLEALLHHVDSDAELLSIRRRLCLLKARLAAQGQEINFLIQESAYRAKLIDKLVRQPSRAHQGGE